MQQNNRNKNMIPVAYATDQNYLFYTCVSITSLAENANRETNYQVYILVGKGFKDEAGLIRKLGERFSNIHIKKIVVDSSAFDKVFINNQHISRAAFYRLAVCDVLTEDKCIYLDSDTIVTEDLTSLYDYDMEGFYLAGCHDVWIDVLTAEEREKRRVQTRIPGMDNYINSGVLLFNLKKLREDGLNSTFLEHLNYDYPYEDQDILNVCCYQHILCLPAKWNRFTAAIGRDEELRLAGVPESVILEYKSGNGILHFITKEARPWEGFEAWENWRWWQYARLWKEEELYERMHRYVEERECQNSWKECVKKCSASGYVVLWGATAYAEEVCRWLLRALPDLRISFCDSDEAKQGKRIEGIEVKLPREIFLEKRECLFFITSQRWGKEIKATLLKEGISEDKILMYRRKGMDFYRMLDSRYYAQELEEIFLKEGVAVTEGCEIQELLRHDDWIEKYSLRRWVLSREQYQGLQ